MPISKRTLAIGTLIVSANAVGAVYLWQRDRNQFAKCTGDAPVCQIDVAAIAKSRSQLAQLMQIQLLLSQHQWQEADRSTTELLETLAAERSAELNKSESFSRAIACTDMHTIDKLWVSASDGKYGFGVQKQIWDRLPQQTIEAMSQQVGWDADVAVKQRYPAGQFPTIGDRFFGEGLIWYSRHEPSGSEYPIDGPDPTSTSDWCCQYAVTFRLELCGF